MTNEFSFTLQQAIQNTSCKSFKKSTFITHLWTYRACSGHKKLGRIANFKFYLGRNTQNMTWQNLLYSILRSKYRNMKNSRCTQGALTRSKRRLHSYITLLTSSFSSSMNTKYFGFSKTFRSSLLLNFSSTEIVQIRITVRRVL